MPIVKEKPAKKFSMALLKEFKVIDGPFVVEGPVLGRFVGAGGTTETGREFVLLCKDVETLRHLWRRMYIEQRLDESKVQPALAIVQAKSLKRMK